MSKEAEHSCRVSRFQERVRRYSSRVLKLQREAQSACEEHNTKKGKFEPIKVYTGQLSGEGATWKAKELAEILSEGAEMGLGVQEITEMLETEFRAARSKKPSFEN